MLEYFQFVERPVLVQFVMQVYQMHRLGPNRPDSNGPKHSNQGHPNHRSVTVGHQFYRQLTGAHGVILGSIN